MTFVNIVIPNLHLFIIVCYCLWGHFSVNWKFWLFKIFVFSTILDLSKKVTFQKIWLFKNINLSKNLTFKNICFYRNFDFQNLENLEFWKILTFFQNFDFWKIRTFFGKEIKRSPKRLRLRLSKTFAIIKNFVLTFQKLKYQDF